MHDTLKRLENQIMNELQKVVDKADMTPAELEVSSKAVCVLKELKEYEYMTNPMRNTSMDMYSDARGRDPMTGQYISRNSVPMYYGTHEASSMMQNPGTVGNSYNNGYSGHSIKDRMFQRLEQMLPEAQNDGERQLIHDYMRKLESE